MTAPVTPETLTDGERTLSELPVRVGRDTHLERCDLAKRGGPDATLACAECGRARWMHRTRHDTCGQFCYVTHYTITELEIQTLRFVESTPHDVKVACSRALNEFGLSGHLVREAKRLCAAEFNRTMGRVRDAINARAKENGNG